MRKLMGLAVALALVTSASAATFTASLALPAGNTVGPNAPLAIEVRGVLSSTTDNDGLVFVSVDLHATSSDGGPAVNLGTAVLWNAPADHSMDNFVQPAGYDANYGGTPVGNDLVQSGGAQNTIGNNPATAPMLPFPAAEFITFHVAHSQQVILQGAITFPPGTEGHTYTLSLANVLANVLADGQSPHSFGVYQVVAADTATGGTVDVDVEDCALPGFRAAVAGTSFGQRAWDGFIDARRESTNGSTIIGLNSITVEFTTSLQNNGGGALSASAFSLTSSSGTAPTITGITTADNRIVTVNLSGHLVLEAWNSLGVNAQSECGQVNFSGFLDIGYLPGDIDQNRIVNPLDLLKFKQYVNNVQQPPLGVRADFIDTNRDGNVNPLDLLSFKQLINGVNPPATHSWSGHTLPAQPAH